MEARAQARFVRVTPLKARRVVDVIRGMKADEAAALLRFAPQAADTADGGAEVGNNDGLVPDSLYVAEAYVDEGPTMKRFRPRAQGRAYRVAKRTSHITVVVEERTPVQRTRSTAGSRGGAR